MNSNSITIPKGSAEINVLVTGGAGFIGSHTAEKLMRTGANVIVVDEMNEYYDISIKHENLAILHRTAVETGSSFKFYQLDICQKEELEQIILDEHITDIIHLAARAGVRASIQQPELYVHSNVLASMVIFDLATKHKTKIRHVVYASSSSVYGMNDKVPFSETDCINKVVSPYAATKVASEAMATAYANMHKFPITGLRFFTVYGPRGRPDMAPFKFIDKVMRGETIDQYGDGSSSRDYTYIEDIVSGILGALNRPLNDSSKNYHEVYNLGNSTPVTLKRFIELVEKVCDKTANRKILPQQKGDVEKTFADVSKANADFGYDPLTPLESGLFKLAEWWRSKYEKQGGGDLGYHSGSCSDDLASEASSDS